MKQKLLNEETTTLESELNYVILFCTFSFSSSQTEPNVPYLYNAIFYSSTYAILEQMNSMGKRCKIDL